MKNVQNELLKIILNVKVPLIAGKFFTSVQNVKANFSSILEMEDCRKVEVCPGFDLFHEIKLNLSKMFKISYTNKVLMHLGMNCTKSVYPNLCQINENDLNDERIDSTSCSQAIWSRMCLILCTCPDISFASGRLSQDMNRAIVNLCELL